MSEEQAIYGLIVTAQEQQKIAADQLAAMQELKATIRQAGDAVQAMRLAGDASAAVIEKATQKAVEKAVQGALERISEKTRSVIVDATNPAVRALQGVTARAEQAEENLHRVGRSISWKWLVIWAATGAVLSGSFVGLSMLLVPTPSEIAQLRATVAELEARGGKVELIRCGPNNRLCAKINVQANESTGGWGKKGEYMILQGY